METRKIRTKKIKLQIIKLDYIKMLSILCKLVINLRHIGIAHLSNIWKCFKIESIIVILIKTTTISYLDIRSLHIIIKIIYEQIIKIISSGISNKSTMLHDIMLIR